MKDDNGFKYVECMHYVTCKSGIIQSTLYIGVRMSQGVHYLTLPSYRGKMEAVVA